MERVPSIRSTMILVCVGHFMIDFMLGIWPAYKTMAGVDLALAGTLMAFSAFLGEGGQLVSGPLADRGHGKFLILIGVAFSSLMALIPNFSSLPIWACLVGVSYISSGMFHPAAGSLIGMINHPRKGLLMSMFAASGALGLALSQLVFSRLYFTIGGGTALLMIPAIGLLLWGARGQFGSKPKEPKGQFKLNDLLPLIKNPSFRSLYFGVVCLQCVAWSTIFLLPDILVARQMPNWVAFGAGHMAYMLGGAVMAVPAGMLADKIGEKPVMIAASVASWASMTLFLTVETLPIPLVLTSLFFAGGCLYANQGNSLTLGNKLVPGCPGLVGTCLMGLAWIFAEGLAPVSSGFLSKVFVEHGPAKALTMITGLCLLGAGLLSRIRVEEPETAAVIA